MPSRRIDPRSVGAVGILLLGFALPLWGLLHYQGPPMEEGFMLAFPIQVLHGQVPNKDFLHLYGPGSLWVLAGAFKVFGTTLLTERMVGLAQHLGIVFGIYFLARPWGRRLAVLCGLISLVIVIPPIGLTALAWNGAVALALVGLVVATYTRKLAPDDPRAGRRMVLAGVLAGAALLYRPDQVVAVSLGFGAALWGVPRPWLKRFGIAAVATSALMLVQVALAGIGPAFKGMVVQPVFQLRPGRSLPIPPSWGQLDGFLQKAGGLRVARWPLPMLDPSNQVFLWFWLTPLCGLFVAAVAIRRMRQDPTVWRHRVLLAGALFGLGILPQAFQRPDTAHFAWVSCVVMALTPVAITEVLAHRAPRVSARVRPLLAGGSVLLVLIAVIPFFSIRTYVDITGQSFGFNRFGYVMERDGRRFYYGSQPAAHAAQQLIDDLDAASTPGQRLFVGPVDLRKTPYSDAFFYYLFPELPPATRYIEMDPGIANAPDSGLADEVRSAHWLILSNVWSSWDEPNDSRVFGPDEPNQVVRDHFCLRHDYGGYFQLWERCR